MADSCFGIVYKSTGSWYTVKTNDNKLYDCRIKGRFRIQGIKSTNPIAVGDKVVFTIETKNNTKTGIIHGIENRKNYIVRKSVNLSKQTHIIAANIDQVFLLVTLRNPPTLTGFIDRFLVTTEAYSIKTILLFNKIDSYNKTDEEALEVLMEIYKKIGYTCIEVSAIKRFNIDKVKSQMKSRVSMFAGHSGVGKSSLVNAIEPSLNLKTKALSSLHMQGQHTTTFAEMFDLSFGAKIIDTPGIKGFGVVDMDKEELSDYFPEFFKLKPQCKFNNCLHLNEPHCAVKKAIEHGEISSSRYKSYLQILEDNNAQYRIEPWV